MDNKTYKDNYSKDHWESWGDKIIHDLIRGESVTIYGMYGSGREFFLRHLAAYLPKLDKSRNIIIELRADLFSSIIEEDFISYFKQQITKQIPSMDINLSYESQTRQNSKILLLEILEDLTEKGFNIYILVNYLEKWLNRKAILSLQNYIRDLNILKIRFCCSVGVSILPHIEKYREAGSIIFSNLRQVPFFQKRQAARMMKSNAKIFNWKYSNKTLESIFKLSGGNPGLIKYLHRLFSRYKNQPSIEEIINDESIKYKINKHFSEIQFLLNTKKQIKGDFLNYVNETEKELLLHSGYIDEDGVIFSPLLQEYISKSKVSKKIDKITNSFTANEYRLFKYLKDNLNDIKTVDDIAQILWGKSVYKKYSLWSIYKVIGNLRKKLRNSGFSIKNIRGRGYALEKVEGTMYKAKNKRPAPGNKPNQLTS